MTSGANIWIPGKVLIQVDEHGTGKMSSIVGRLTRTTIHIPTNISDNQQRMIQVFR